ncbi:hypothetical protein CTAYLR_001786 [Chrysophaeum taylorii]|uniref:Cyclic nucleotide-binding domain-containing protein n=1 Tax=Chrysophaeum taylorii TaxID=2483200 RepID=A0AAD7UEQ4_9STRA|nr:hypothetical protein CTAYLR_001786 [Chrysophaeum taylorii]
MEQKSPKAAAAATTISQPFGHGGKRSARRSSLMPLGGLKPPQSGNAKSSRRELPRLGDRRLTGANIKTISVDRRKSAVASLTLDMVGQSQSSKTKRTNDGDMVAEGNRKTGVLGTLQRIAGDASSTATWTLTGDNKGGNSPGSSRLRMVVFDQMYQKISRAQKQERDHESMVNQFKLRSTNTGLRGDSNWINFALSNPQSVALLAPRGRWSAHGWSHAARVALLLTTLGQEKDVLAVDDAGVVAATPETLREQEILNFLKEHAPRLVTRISNDYQIATEIAELRSLLEDEHQRTNILASAGARSTESLFPFVDRATLIDQVTGLQAAEANDGWKRCVKKRVAHNLLVTQRSDELTLETMGEVQQRRPLMPAIHPQSLFARAWDFLLLLFVMEQFVMIPFGISFELTPSEELLDFVAELFFLIDIAFRFNLAFVEDRDDNSTTERTEEAVPGVQDDDASGGRRGVDDDDSIQPTTSEQSHKKKRSLVTDRVQIAKNYSSKPAFVVDVVSAFPIVVSVVELANNDKSQYQWVRILKFFRLLKLGKMINIVRQIHKLALETILSSSRRGWINIWQYSRFLAMVKLGGLFVLIGLAMHSLACVWHFVTPQSHWQIRLLEAADDDGVRYERISRKKLYLLSYYEAILILMGEQIGMERMYEYAFAIMATILFSFLLAIIFGEVAIFIATINEVPLAYGRKMAQLHDTMSINAFPRALQDRVFSFYDYIWNEHKTLDGSMKIVGFLPELTPHLATEVRLFWCKDMLLTVPFFKLFPPPVVQRLVAAVEMSFYMPDDYIIVVGEIGHEMFFLKTGKVDVFRVEEAEIEIASDLESTRERRHSRSSFNQSALQQLLGKSKSVKHLKNQQDGGGRRPSRGTVKITPADKAVPATKRPSMKLAGGGGRMSFGRFASSRMSAAHEATKSQKINGKRVRRIQREQILTTLHQGSYFGEVALVTNAPRTATVRARTFAECAIVHRKDFEEMLVDHPHNLKQVSTMVRSKYQASTNKKNLVAAFRKVKPVAAFSTAKPVAAAAMMSQQNNAPKTCENDGGSPALSKSPCTVMERMESLESAVATLEARLVDDVQDALLTSLEKAIAATPRLSAASSPVVDMSAVVDHEAATTEPPCSSPPRDFFSRN